MSLSWMFWCRIYTNFLACLISTYLKLQLQKSTFDTQIVLWPGSPVCHCFLWRVNLGLVPWCHRISGISQLFVMTKTLLYMATTWLPHGYHMATTWLPHDSYGWLPWLPRDSQGTSQGSPLARPRSRIEKSHRNVTQWVTDLRKVTGEIPIVVVGNKVDLPQRVVKARNLVTLVTCWLRAGNVLVSLSELWSSWSPKCVQNVNFREAQRRLHDDAKVEGVKCCEIPSSHGKFASREDSKRAHAAV